MTTTNKCLSRLDYLLTAPTRETAYNSINIGAIKTAHRKSANRYAQLNGGITKLKATTRINNNEKTYFNTIYSFCTD